MMPNPMQMISHFPQFMRRLRGQDPQQLLNQLVQSGRVNQQRLTKPSKWHSRCRGSLSNSGACLASERLEGKQ